MSYWSSQEAQTGQWSEVKWSESHSVVSDSLWPHGPYSPWNSSGQNTGMGSCSFLQGIVPAQGLNPGFPHCRWNLHQLNTTEVQSGQYYTLSLRTLSSETENKPWPPPCLDCDASEYLGDKVDAVLKSMSAVSPSGSEARDWTVLPLRSKREEARV